MDEFESTEHLVLPTRAHADRYDPAVYAPLYVELSAV
jgi:hypothetical protein